MLNTQKYLRGGGTLQQLVEKFALKANRHPKFSNLVMLKYSQTESPMGQEIVQECRGLILDEANDWAVVSYPFRKFFNYGEGHAPAIDWGSAKVYEKLDGSLMTLYWYGASFTFAELFWQVFWEKGYLLPQPEPPFTNFCFMFELMTKWNRVVVPHAESRLVLIGAREIVSDRFDEFSVRYISQNFNWEVVRSFPLNSLEACLAAAKELNPMDSEGYVVCDGSFNRVKVKSPQYVALAHLKEGMSPRRLLEIVRANESQEFLTYFPEFKEEYDKVRAAFDDLVCRLELVYERIKGAESQKEFALEATKTPLSSALFALRNKKSATIREYLADCTINALERAIGMDFKVYEVDKLVLEEVQEVPDYGIKYVRGK